MSDRGEFKSSDDFDPYRLLADELADELVDEPTDELTAELAAQLAAELTADDFAEAAASAELLAAGRRPPSTRDRSGGAFDVDSASRSPGRRGRRGDVVDSR